MEALFLNQTQSNHYTLWKDAIQKIDPSVKLVDGNSRFDPENIDIVLTSHPPEGIFSSLTHLKFIQSLSMGVDNLLNCDDLNRSIPIARIIDPDMAKQMCHYVLYGVLNIFRNFLQYRQLQQQKCWKKITRSYTNDVNIGILGLGNLGLSVANALVKNNFSVIGWSRSPKIIGDILTFAGNEMLDDFLSQTDILVCLLPLTSETRNLISYNFLQKLRKNAYIINPARGEHIVDDDLIRAIHEEHISGALLDVFRHEPLPENHPFWKMPSIDITPHIAAQVNPHTAAYQVVQNIHYIRNGQPALNLINIEKEY